MSNPFQILGGQPVEEINKSLPLNDRISSLINSSSIVLFMKGTPQMPQCGFSANVVRILDSLSVSYNTFNILSDMEIREGVKTFSNWPTYPQLYVKGQLIGGNDIVTEMMNNGELKELLKM
jgi:monothiol glutaredoxin